MEFQTDKLNSLLLFNYISLLEWNNLKPILCFWFLHWDTMQPKYKKRYIAIYTHIGRPSTKCNIYSSAFHVTFGKHFPWVVMDSPKILERLPTQITNMNEWEYIGSVVQEHNSCNLNEWIYTPYSLSYRSATILWLIE